MTGTNLDGNPLQAESPQIPVNIQLQQKLFDTYTNLVKGNDYGSDVYLYRLKERVCLLTKEDTANVKNSLISCLSLSVGNRRMVCPQSLDCPMMHDNTTVSVVDKRKKNILTDDFEDFDNLPKTKIERKKRIKKEKTNMVQGPALNNDISELDTDDLIHTSDTFIPEIIASELMERADADIYETATDDDIYLAQKARLFIELITKSYKTNNPTIAVERLIDNAIKKIPEVEGKY